MSTDHKYGTANNMVYPYVFHSDLKPLRNKYGACTRCSVLPLEGVKFRKCAACKAVLYCSKECQRAHWNEHRVACKDVQNLQDQNVSDSSDPAPNASPDPSERRVIVHGLQRDNNDTSWPASIPTDKRAIMLSDFVSMHRTNFVYSVSVLRRSLQRQFNSDVDLDSCTTVFTLGYRRNSDGNPATRLFVKKVEVLPCNMEGPAWEMETEGASNSTSQTQASRGTAGLIWQGGGVQVCLALSLQEFSLEDKSTFDDHWADWITHLRFVTTVGIVYAPDVKTGESVPGLMCKKRKDWEWEQISLDDLQPLRERKWRYLGPEPEVHVNAMSVAQ